MEGFLSVALTLAMLVIKVAVLISGPGGIVFLNNTLHCNIVLVYLVNAVLFDRHILVFTKSRKGLVTQTPIRIRESMVHSTKQ